MTVEYREIAVGTDLHRSEQELRDAVLRRPLGRSLSATDLARDKTGHHFVGVEDGAVVACVGLYPDGAQLARLRQMAVDPARQGQGLGRGVLAFALDWARANGVTRIETHARCTARGFYDRAGFAAEGEEFPENGIPHIFMWKAL